MAHPRRFLTAAWRYLAMLNYPVRPEILAPYVPSGTRLDAYRGVTYVSMVGFLFEDTRLAGIPLPGHRNFEEVNLRFYVQRHVDGEVRRGVVFLRELVPRRLIAWTARAFYNEPYQAVPMRHEVNGFPTPAQPGRVTYEWQFGERWNQLQLDCQGQGPPHPLAPDSLEQFIAEHYWGYCRQRDGGTIEYRVEHPSWNVWGAHDASLQADVAALYGSEFVEPLSQPPASAFLADGSEVTVYRPRRLG